MGLYPGGAQIIAGTDAGTGSCPGRSRPRSDVPVPHHVELVVARGTQYRPAPRRVPAAPSGPGPR